MMTGCVDKHWHSKHAADPNQGAVITGSAIISNGAKRQAGWVGLAIKLALVYLIMLAILATAPSWHRGGQFQAGQVLACTDSGGIR